jgi:hypothetical protein
MTIHFGFHAKKLEGVLQGWEFYVHNGRTRKKIATADNCISYIRKREKKGSARQPRRALFCLQFDKV